MRRDTPVMPSGNGEATQQGHAQITQPSPGIANALRHEVPRQGGKDHCGDDQRRRFCEQRGAQQQAEHGVSNERDIGIGQQTQAEIDARGGQRGGKNFVGDVMAEVQVRRQQRGQQQAEELRPRPSRKHQAKTQKREGERCDPATHAQQTQRNHSARIEHGMAQHAEQRSRDHVVKWRLIHLPTSVASGRE